MEFLVYLIRLFATLIGVHLVGKNRFIDEYWQRSVQLGAFENAWEAIGNEGVYYLMLGTSHPPYDCVSINVTAVFPKIAIHYEVTKYNASFTVNETYTGTALIHKDVRGVESTIEWIKNGTGRREQTQVLYTDKYNSCYVLYYTCTGDYELWVHENETDFIPRCCEFSFVFVTYELETYYNFNKTICKT
ncbi:male-specific histamine-binding salivary protein-like [Ixodes scapularis]|uniref:male-specific histamine-binding salivary protein-like n=1 Tax=Ixodes scapularis TaxID=6945 RepID=UPI001C3953D7|nr:male-specific histamine-binding salivary protein-like [Ixodes scapularis]